jgi:hypothetical protein
VVATRLQQSAQAERDRAEFGRSQNLSRQLAAESTLTSLVDPRRAAMAALGSWRAGSTLEGRSALLSARADSYRGRMTGHLGAITGIAVSSDGKTAATGGRDGSLRLWDVPERRERAVLHDGDGWYRTVAMSDDGRFLVAADPLSKKVELWDVPGRERVFTVPGTAIDAVISPDGRTFAAFTDRGVVVWDTGTLAERVVFPVADRAGGRRQRRGAQGVRRLRSGDADRSRRRGLRPGVRPHRRDPGQRLAGRVRAAVGHLDVDPAPGAVDVHGRGQRGRLRPGRQVRVRRCDRHERLRLGPGDR